MTSTLYQTHTMSEQLSCVGVTGATFHAGGSRGGQEVGSECGFALSHAQVLTILYIPSPQKNKMKASPLSASNKRNDVIAVPNPHDE